MAKKNLASIAKSGKSKTTTKSTQKNKTGKKVEKKTSTPEEERDLKAKQTVEKLLEGIELKPKKDGDTVEVETTTKKEGKEWLEEQVGLLSEQVEKLRGELVKSKEDYTKIYDELQSKKSGSNNMLNDTLIENVLTIFNELQANLLGRNPERTPHDIVKIDYLLKQMLQLFPFTEQNKKF